jgi:hypothetical protein
MTSIGYTNPNSGSYGTFNPFIVNPKSSGGAIKGFMPKQILLVDKRYPEFEQIRFTLKNAWNTTYPGQLRANKIKKAIITPFRAVNNLGDYLSRQNYVCGGSNQVNASRPGWKGHIGSILSACDKTGVAASVTNNKFVPDSSDYITYKKQRAISQNYNDLGFGGDQNNASYVNLMSVRRS